MNRQRILEQLQTAKPDLAQRFGVTELALFGSAARDTVGPASDFMNFTLSAADLPQARHQPSINSRAR